MIGAPYLTSVEPDTPVDIYAHCITDGGTGLSVPHDVYIKNASDQEFLIGSSSDTGNSPPLGYALETGDHVRVSVSSGDRLFLVNNGGSDITGKVYVMVVTH